MSTPAAPKMRMERRQFHYDFICSVKYEFKEVEDDF